MKNSTINIGIMFCILFFLSSLSAKGQSHSQQIEKVLSIQENAWNKGNLEAFMQGYWNSDSLIFVGKSGLNYGFDKVLANYKKSYVDKNAMGILHFDILKIDVLSDSTAFVLGTWQLTRKSDKPGGIFSLLFKKINGEWKIVVDHTN